ncbi:MAPEG family protein [Oleiagrimonas sp. C23AA]|uniref:MAPEG family protein n=1 Tax=Oleiagrimonas sp. C23AA TaxID=2719047 RepID=UPI0014213A96|nr:MAPEG family protein [Oleiagrimonas sp. C23AA]NII09272.1 hypothetical protein [Oleiagrimonas sp. C23AA]
MTMAPELYWLAWAVALGLGYILLAAGLMTWQRGLKWNVGNRDGEAPALSGAAARADRARANFLETFPLFAVLAVAVVLAQRNDAHTALGAMVYVWARVAYWPVYVIGIPYLRTAIWIVSLWGLLQLLEALL